MRVIAGRARGRPLVAPPGRRLRPTTDLVKGAIFSILEAEAMRRQTERSFPYQRVLDLYAGTGALGIEALSRGAEWADFVDTDPRARATISLNLQRTGFASRGKVHAARAEEAASILSGPYDLILADPPYADPGVLAGLERIAGSDLLAPEGLLVLEHDRGFDPPAHIGSLQLDRVRAYGSTRLSLYRRSPVTPPSSSRPATTRSRPS